MAAINPSLTSTLTSTSTRSTTTITDPSQIAIYNRGPATAVYSPPTSCLATLTSKSDMYFGHRTTGYFDPACFPASTTDRGLLGWNLYYYSPAQCPSGWATAARLYSSVGQDETYLTIGTDTTAVVCCPSGNYVYVGGAQGHQCQSAFTSTSYTLTYVSPTLNGNNQWTDTANSNTLIATAAPDYTVFGDGIPIWYQQSDLAVFAQAASTSTSTTQTGSSITSMSASATATDTGSTGLSSGAKIGIGVGIPLAVIAVGLVGAFFWFRRRGRQRVNVTELSEESSIKPPALCGAEPVSELHSEGLYDPHQPRGRYELSESTVQP